MFYFDNDQINITILQQPKSIGQETLLKSLDQYKSYFHFHNFDWDHLNQKQASEQTLVIFLDNSLGQTDLLQVIHRLNEFEQVPFIFYYCDEGDELIAQQCLSIGATGFIYKDRPLSIWPILKQTFQLKTKVLNKKSEVDQEDQKFQKIFKQLDRSLLASDSYLWEIEFPSFKTSVYTAKNDVLGWKLDQLTDKFESWKNLIHPDDRDKVLKALDEHLKFKKEYRVEYRALSASGEYQWTLSLGQADWNENNEPYVFYGVSTNIDPLKKIEQNYQKTSDKFTAFFNNSKDALFIIDTNTLEIMDCNQQASDLYEYTKSELTKMKISDLSLEIEKTSMAFQKRVSHVSIRKHRKKDGSVIFVEASSGYFEADGRQLNAAAIRNITERVHDQNQIKISLSEKELLLKEVFHRVKNNLQIVVSILKVQLEGITDPQTKSIIEQCMSRVMSMAMAHEQLYKKDAFAFVDLMSYLRNLASYLINSYSNPKNKIHFSIEGDPHQLSLDQVIPLGLIANELITNSMKHAFISTPTPQINIQIQSNENKKYLHFFYSDNGLGLPDSIQNLNQQNKTVGLNLIQLLSKQLEGQFLFKSSSSFGYELKIPIKKT